MVNLTAGVVISSLNGAELGPGSVLCHVLELRCVGWSRDTGRGIGPLCTGTCSNFLETLKWMSFQMVYQCLSPYFVGGNSYLQAIQDLFRCSPVYLAFESWSGCREGSVGLKRTIASQSEALEAQSCAIFVAGTSELDPPSWVPGCIPNRCILCHRKMAPLPSLPQVGRRLWTRASSWYRLSMVETCWSYPDHLQCIQPMFKNQWFRDGVHTP